MEKDTFNSFFSAVASGQTPAKEDLEAEGFREVDHRAVVVQVRRVHELRETGQRKAARDLGREFASDWRERYGADEGWAPPAPRHEKPPTDDPRELAARIPRGGA